MQEDERNISQQFFWEVPELIQIEKPFPKHQMQLNCQQRDLDSEFELMRAITESKKHKQGLRKSEGLESRKNRYPEQEIYEHSRVRLSTVPDYINANHLRNSSSQPALNLIITQGPIESTLQDFNTMIIDNHITAIVMLCRAVENGKPRCYDYLSSKTWKVHDDHYEHDGSLEIRKVSTYGSTTQIEHLFYKDWPDKSVPEDTAVLMDLLRKLERHSNILIHCSAGLGRSGVLAAILEILAECSDEKVSIFGGVRKVREGRYGAVQNSQQYRFIYQFFQDYFADCSPSP